MLRAHEIGLVLRAKNMHEKSKPKCQAANVVHPVQLFGVSEAFYVLISKISI